MAYCRVVLSNGRPLRALTLLGSKARLALESAKARDVPSGTNLSAVVVNTTRYREQKLTALGLVTAEETRSELFDDMPLGRGDAAAS